jgi:hypothetical protein
MRSTPPSGRASRRCSSTGSPRELSTQAARDPPTIRYGCMVPVHKVRSASNETSATGCAARSSTTRTTRTTPTSTTACRPARSPIPARAQIEEVLARSRDRRPDRRRGAPPARQHPADRVGELHLGGSARRRRLGAHQQVQRRLSRQALLRGSAGHRSPRSSITAFAHMLDEHNPNVERFTNDG